MNKGDKIKLLLEFCNEKKRVLKRVEEYKGINIGEFYSTIRRGGVNKSIIYDEIKNAEKYKEVLKKEGVIK